MALINPAKEDILYGINQEVLVPLTFAGLIFSPFVLVDETDPVRIKFRLTASSTHPYRGTEVVTVQRLQFNHLSQMLHVPPRLNPLPTLYGLLPHLTRATGIRINESDVEDAPVIEGAEGYRVAMVAKSDSYGWCGEGELLFYDLPPISIPLTDLDIRW